MAPELQAHSHLCQLQCLFRKVGLRLPVGGHDRAPPPREEPRRRDPRPRQTHDHDGLPLQVHGVLMNPLLAARHLSFNVVSASNAKMNATIQNRTTTCVSFQPVSSKWWCRGDMRKMRLPRVLKDTTCRITERASTTNSPPMATSSSSCLIRMATVPRAPPRLRLPTSPMKMRAG